MRYKKGTLTALAAIVTMASSRQEKKSDRTAYMQSN